MIKSQCGDLELSINDSILGLLFFNRDHILPFV